MVEDILTDLLEQYKVDRDFSKEVKEGFRLPLQDSINKIFGIKPHYRYGGSLAKQTANTNSCDIDLLCYFDSDYAKSLEDIYEETRKALHNDYYQYECKNSAITVYGRLGEEWETSVDIVPGKYTSNDDNKDVYLWCRKDKKRLKSNPEIQIGKVLQSDCKEVIRLLKLFRSFNNFKFKSFYLEIFVIDVVSKEFDEKDTIYDKLVKCCRHYSDIGIVKIYDPANRDNDINTIHSDDEFELIRDKIKYLYEILLTNHDKAIRECIIGKNPDVDNAYLLNAKSHSRSLNISKESLPLYGMFTLRGFYFDQGVWREFSSNKLLKKKMELKFEITINYTNIQIKSVKLIVSNAGYEAMYANALRGQEENTEYNKNKRTYERKETTSYYGNHFVQAMVTLQNGKRYHSSLLIVRVR